MTTGDKIKQRRKELGWSLRELSNRMGYANHSTVARIEAGQIDLPQSKVAKFAEVMGTSIAFLLNWEETQKNNDIIADIVVRLRTDENFLSLVDSLQNLDGEQIQSVKQIVSAAFKK